MNVRSFIAYVRIFISLFADSKNDDGLILFQINQKVIMSHAVIATNHSIIFRNAKLFRNIGI